MARTTRKACTPRTLRRESPEARAGLRLAFTTVNTEDATGWCAVHRAQHGYAGALRLFDGLATQHNNRQIGDEAARVAREAFPMLDEGMDSAREPEIMGMAGFVLGFAACWVAMASINAGAPCKFGGGR
jgi:hypothetical protein